MEEELSKKQQKRLERMDEKTKLESAQKLKKILKQAALFLIAAGTVTAVGFWLTGTSRETVALISARGIHWHPNLSIKINGVETAIPANLGLAGVHNPIHTHDESGILHLEFSGAVSEDMIRLKEFFNLWGKAFSKECVLDKCNGPEGAVKMLVNGQPNMEFENYVMRDGDRIEIVFE